MFSSSRLALKTAAEERRRRQGQTQTVGERVLADRPLLAPPPRHPFPVRQARFSADVRALLAELEEQHSGGSAGPTGSS